MRYTAATRFEGWVFKNADVFSERPGIAVTRAAFASKNLSMDWNILLTTCILNATCLVDHQNVNGEEVLDIPVDEPIEPAMGI